MDTDDSNPADSDQSRSSSPSDRRTDLINAAWEMYRNLPLTGVFAGLTSSKVAAAAGVTTGSYFHHFPNAAAFTDALVLAHANKRQETPTSSTATETEPIDAIALLQIATDSIWQDHTEDSAYIDEFCKLLTLWIHRDAPLHQPQGPYETAGDVVRNVVLSRERQLTAAWKELFDQGNIDFRDEFPASTVSMAVTAAFHGLTIRHAMEPESVSDQLFTDIACAIAEAFTTPRRSDKVDPAIEDPDDAASFFDRANNHLSPQAQVGARRRGETRTRILQHCADLFVDGWEQITITEIAERSQVSVQTVINVFGSVRLVAALTFGHHVGHIATAAATQTMSAVDELVAILTALAESASQDSGAARALLAERVRLNGTPVGGVDHLDARREVPIDLLIQRALSTLDPDVPRGLSPESMLTNFVLSEAIGRPDSGADIAAAALRLVGVSASPPDGSAE